MRSSRNVYGEGAVAASARAAAALMGLALAAAPACVELPWRADEAAPQDPSRPLADHSPAVPASADPPAVDRTHEYALVELIDLAQQSNPETREAWQRARAAAARLGQAEAVYLPSLTLVAQGGVQRESFPSPAGSFAAGGPLVEPALQFAWTLLDLSRFADVAEARARVVEADFTFTRKHQEVLFAVARAYYAVDASQAQLEAARATLQSALVVEEAVQARLEAGLATRPELLLAREARTRAAFDVEAAVGTTRAAEGALAESVGVAPDPPLKVAFLADRGPARLASSIEEIMKATLAARPDLKAQRAVVVARRAEERGARGRFAPRLTLQGEGGYQVWWYESTPGARFTMSAPVLDAHLQLEWGLFQGFEDVERVHQAEAERLASEAALTAGSLRAQREAWTAYFDVKTAERKVEFGDSLLVASQEAYDATLETYRRGLGTLIDLLTAERDLASARGTAIESHTELLTAAAALTLAIGARPPGAH
ncbi:MAG TPA: TolC family protein [Polyangiaceae bacterium]|nr:TolC family protein [Polyangiaceae bacterium]